VKTDATWHHCCGNTQLTLKLTRIASVIDLPLQTYLFARMCTRPF